MQVTCGADADGDAQREAHEALAVAELDPVPLAGTTVSRAGLHNFPELARKDIRVGDMVLVEKAGDIIPQVVGVDLAARPEGTAPFVAPSHCPSCQSEVVTEEIFVYCPNPACPDQVLERLKHFAGRQAMDIDGMGEALLAQVIDHMGVRRPDDLFRLTAQQLAGLERMGEKSAQNLIDQVESHRELPLAVFLQALGAPHLGKQNATLLAGEFLTLDRIRTLTRDELMAIKGIKDAIENPARILLEV